jgi:bZIP-type transcription factor MBZ1
MSTSTQSQSSSSRSNSQQANCLDPLDALIDFSEYETVSYQSPSISPAASAKPQFVRPVASTPTANNALLPSNQQTLSGPSHNYDLYKQQTGIPPASIANTLAMNTNNLYTYNYMSGLNTDDFLDFGSAPKNPSFDMDLEFDSPSTEPAFFYPEQSLSSSSEYVNPSAIGGQDNQAAQSTSALPTQTSNVGRLWPGMHQQQAALAKSQQQQKQQQQLVQQQRQQSMTQPSKARSKSHQATDPIVEEKISQLLNSMRQSSVTTSENDDGATPSAMTHAQRMRKDEEDMDEDERLLASEEGKKLSSKERRQLRNKVSARAFRSRRKGKL